MSLAAILQEPEIIVDFNLKAVYTIKKGLKKRCYVENEALLLLAASDSKGRHKKTEIFPSGTIDNIEYEPELSNQKIMSCLSLAYGQYWKIGRPIKFRVSATPTYKITQNIEKFFKPEALRVKKSGGNMFG
ncbi:hypothetical protein HYT26_03400 [Candidatus Pacearchaeota archaeon]|nr:hypothetical protein [Candidatus Pacearchaeota archaeon]